MAGMAGEREREQDIRVYEQIPAVMGFYEKNKVWGIGTGMDRLEKGKGGILSAVAKMTERLCSGLVYLLVCSEGIRRCIWNRCCDTVYRCGDGFKP